MNLNSLAMYRNLNERQKALHDFMSNVSEETWCASWINGLEYALWHIMLRGPAKYGQGHINEHTIEKLQSLSEQANCWIVYDSVTEETPVPISEWLTMFQFANPNEYLYTRR
ncbi:hypothetical protein SAMN06269173_102236 [Hymenobacter mucosus]|uniref:Uncharacterized protein n=1 Tax=Hymenobacter mucosus TaxID=1411120 RepID=A0A238W7G6_9BACT|nr:hypothetical protein SAMN06269173_102236 [Hymenobacter mucosus]